MNDSDMKQLLWESPWSKTNRIFPDERATEVAHSESGPVSEVPDVNEIEETKRSEQAPLEIETLPPN